MRALVVLALSSTIAHAQPPGLTPPSEPRRRAPKDRSTAMLFSFTGTLVPILMSSQVGKTDYRNATLALTGAFGVLLPSAGHWYAGRFWTTGMGIRLLGAGVATMGVLAAASGDGDGGHAAEAVELGLATMAVGAIWDIGTSGAAVDAWNRKLELAPTAIRFDRGNGFGIVGAF